MGEECVKLTMANINENTSWNNNSIPLHFVLIHGIGGGAWCWYKIRTLMENSGYRVTCLDLKGAGIDQTDPNTILSFEDYNKPLLDFLSSLHDNEQVILVGHSAGGLSVSNAIHRFGKKKIRVAVFVAATMLKLGYLTDEDIKVGVPDLSEFGEPSEVCDLEFGLGQDYPPTSMLVKKQFQRKIGYHMSPQEENFMNLKFILGYLGLIGRGTILEINSYIGRSYVIMDSKIEKDWTLASMLLRPGPIQALTTARFVEGEDADKVPRIFIKTTKDYVVKPEQQEAMIKKWPPLDVYVMESDHNPIFSAPFLLCGLLVKAALSLDMGSC